VEKFGDGRGKRSRLGNPDGLLTITSVSQLLVSRFQTGNKVLLFGNGGSAADAQYIAAELVGRFNI
jgi:D-sedoheptulose 7-phosphate isomerase